jgi:hypothetical protein
MSRPHDLVGLSKGTTQPTRPRRGEEQTARGKLILGLGVRAGSSDVLFKAVTTTSTCHGGTCLPTENCASYHDHIGLVIVINCPGVLPRMYSM